MTITVERRGGPQAISHEVEYLLLPSETEQIPVNQVTHVQHVYVQGVDTVPNIQDVLDGKIELGQNFKKSVLKKGDPEVLSVYQRLIREQMFTFGGFLFVANTGPHGDCNFMILPDLSQWSDKTKMPEQVNDLPIQNTNILFQLLANGARYALDKENTALVYYSMCNGGFRSFPIPHVQALRRLNKEVERSQSVPLSNLEPNNQLRKMFTWNERGIEISHDVGKSLTRMSNNTVQITNLQMYTSGTVDLETNLPLNELLSGPGTQIWEAIEILQDQAAIRALAKDSHSTDELLDYVKNRKCGVTLFYQYKDQLTSHIRIMTAVDMRDGLRPKGGPVEALHGNLVRDLNTLATMIPSCEYHLRTLEFARSMVNFDHSVTIPQMNTYNSMQDYLCLEGWKNRSRPYVFQLA